MKVSVQLRCQPPSGDSACCCLVCTWDTLLVAAGGLRPISCLLYTPPPDSLNLTRWPQRLACSRLIQTTRIAGGELRLRRPTSPHTAFALHSQISHRSPVLQCWGAMRQNWISGGAAAGVQDKRQEASRGRSFKSGVAEHSLTMPMSKQQRSCPATLTALWLFFGIC